MEKHMIKFLKHFNGVHSTADLVEYSFLKVVKYTLYK